MTDKRLEQGIKNLQEIDGEAGERVIESLETIAPDVGRYILEFAFGDIYNKDTVLPRTGDCYNHQLIDPRRYEKPINGSY